jgi:extradiol dioxygenase family protein
MSLPPFHLAFAVDDLAAARAFYGELLGCPEGRSAGHGVDFDLYGHQIVAHLAPSAVRAGATNPVDGEEVPVPHFGLVLPMEQWRELARRLE